MNFATELRIAYSNGIKQFLKDNPEAFDPKKYGVVGMEYVTKVVKDHQYTDDQTQRYRHAIGCQAVS